MTSGYFLSFLSGTLVTLQVTLAGSIVAVAVAMLIGLMRLSELAPIRWLAITYIEFFRGSSVLVQLFWWYFVLPHFGINLPAMLVGIIGIGMNVGAYGAEVVRAAIQSVSKGQYEAAIALNMSRVTRMRRIIIPQAVIAMLPPWGNLLIELLKATALVSLITLHDLAFVGQQLNATSPKIMTLEIFGAVLLIYYLIGRGLVSPLIRYLERRLSRGMVRVV